ncbi:MAG: Ca-activated chloride channel [Chthoniobacter sp.]|jgi:Ca-activated chloride channel family protein|nr:Ca-activated chloride channel [Chthoniobacter sp.]
MTFGQPLWFWAFALFPLLLFVFIRNEGLRRSLLRQVVAPRLHDQLAGSVSVGKRRFRFALLLAGAASIILSLTQPRLGYTWEQSKRKGRDVLIAIDVSKSMLATDLLPSRLARAKLAAQDLISQLQGDRVGLIAFAGTAFLQAPLTADFSAVLNSLSELDTEIIPRGGSNLAEAIRVAVEAFGKGESEHRALIIFTDGEELEADGVEAAEKQKGAVKIFTVGVGSADGSLIPMPGAGGGTEFVRDEAGQFVKSRLDETRMRKIAESAGGFYIHLDHGPAEMTQIVREGLGKMTEKEIDAKMSRQPIERYQWPLAAGLVLLSVSMLVGERKRGAGRAIVRAAALLAIWAGSAMAEQTPYHLYQDGRYEAAEKGYAELLEKNPKSDKLAFNWGAAAYKNKDFETALKAFSQALTTGDPQLRAKAEYNLGNTLFQKGSEKLDRKTLEDALGHYKQALDLRSGDANALHNKKVTEELLEKLKQQEQEKEQEKKNQQKQDQEKKDQEKQDQEKQDQQKQDGDPKKGEKKDQDPAAAAQNGGDQTKKPDAKDGEGKEGPQSPPAKEKQGVPKKQNEGGKQPPDKDAQAKDSPDGQKAKPEPVPEQSGEKRTGELKANPSQSQEANDAQEEAADQLAAVEGKMTEGQAKALLESLKNEDEKVRLLDPNERKRTGRVLRDW